MGRATWVLVEGKSWSLLQWVEGRGTLHSLDQATDSMPAQVARCVAEIISSQTTHENGLVLALDSYSCLASTWIPNVGGDVSSRQSLIFELEERLPLAAEEMVADFVVGKPSIFAVAIETKRYLSLIRGLQDQGIQLQAITAAALLVANYIAHDLRHETSCIVLWERDEWLEFVEIERGMPLSWQLLSKNELLLQMQLGMRALNITDPLTLLAFNLTPPVRRCIEENERLTLKLIELPDYSVTTDHRVEDSPSSENAISDLTPWHIALAGSTSLVLACEQSPWIDFARDALVGTDPYRPVRGLIRFSTVLGGIFLLVLAATFTYRAYHYENQAKDLVTRQTDLFRQALPSHEVPLGIRSRMESELTKLAALGGSDMELPGDVSSLRLLYEVLASLPDSLRFRILEIRLEEHRVDLDGELQSHGDADHLSAAFRSRNFDVQPPQTQQINEQTIAVRLVAEYRPPKIQHKPNSNPQLNK